MTGDDESLELKLARQAYAEADAMKKAAERDLEAARYERGQIEHAKRFIEQTEKSVAQREQRLTAGGIADLDRREREVAKDLAEIKALKADYDAAKHGAARALVEINEREKAERSAAA